MNKYSTGCEKSPYDVRTFASPVMAYVKQKGGKRYNPKDIESQKKVGICTGISKTQKARKEKEMKFSADFQYLCQKKYYDKNWKEGSSIFHALKVAKNIGLLPEEEWTLTTLEDRKLPYHEYIKKLQSLNTVEFNRLIKIANKYKIKAYAKVPVTRDAMAQAIDDSNSGILARFVIGKEWWTPPIEPLRKPVKKISGHAVTISNFDGGSFRIANTWGDEWATGGTAYFLLRKYAPTECWKVWYWDDKLPKKIEKKLESREAIVGQIFDLLQKIILLVVKLK